ncbi:MAG: hypothetical protein QM757_25785 [Paludibaculum sp.]
MIVNIMRAGPGLGNIARSRRITSRWSATAGTATIALVWLPLRAQEMADLTSLGFELADKYRNPVHRPRLTASSGK